MSDLSKLLMAGLEKRKPAPTPKRAPTRTNPRPSAPRSMGAVRPEQLANLNPQYFQIQENRKKWEPPREPITPRTTPSRSTVRHSPRTGRLGLSIPVDGDWDDSSFSSGGDFGPRTHPVHGGYSNHTGLDFSLPLGTPVYAPRSGVVEEANTGDSVYGNQIIMRHGPKLQTMYGHLNELASEPGQRVRRGDVLGYIGSTGLSTGPHLHWETWKNGAPVDPRGLWNPQAPRRAPKQPQVVQADAPTKVKRAPVDNSVLGELLQASELQSANPVKQGNNNNRDARLDAFLRAISAQESGDNYGAIGVPTKYGTAYGKYQVLDANIEGPEGWDMEALGRNIGVDEFLNNPKLQEAIVRKKLSDYFRQYGPGGAAAAWYAGPGNANANSNAPQYGGPSINGYRDSVLARMRQNLR